MRQHKNSIILYCLVCCCLFIIAAKAQHLQKPFRKLSTRDGLPQSFISGLVQDKDGFVWIGTRNGLVRYDGRHFNLFQHSSNDTASLSSNLIVYMLHDSSNRIYIEHEFAGIDELNATTEHLQRVTDRPLFRSQPVSFMRRGWQFDKAGNFWCVDGKGLHKYNWQQNRVLHYTRQANHLLSDSIIGLLLDDRQQIWVTTRQGLSRLNEQSGSFENIPFPASQGFITSGTNQVDVIGMHQCPNGEIVISDHTHLIFYHPQRRTFRYVLLPVALNKPIYKIQTGPDGNDYFEIDGPVYRYDKQHRLTAIGDIGLTTFRDATSFLVDRSGLIWLGTNAAGIHQIDVNAPFFESHPGEVPFHYYLLKKEFGAMLDQFTNWPVTDKNFNLSSYFFRSTYDRQGRLWIALRDKTGYWDTARQKLIFLPPIPGICSQQILTWGIRGISFAPNGTLWVIGDKGYVGYYNTAKQQWQTFLDPSVLQQKFKVEISLVDLVVDAGKLWITSGTGEGILVVDTKTRQIQQINQQLAPGVLPTNHVLGMLPDPVLTDILWIGSYEGLIRLNKKTLQSASFSFGQGLPDNTIYSIQSDKAGFLWLSTNQGLCRFHPVTRQVRVFKTENGLPGNEFNRFNHLTLPDGRLAFGGMDGWVLFNPSTVGTDNYQPQVSFTGLKIYNEPVQYTTGNKLLPRPLNELQKLALAYSQNTLTFEFAGLEFNQPTGLQYRYRLASYDDDWVTTNNPSATYTRLPPGSYTLQLRCTNTVGQWSSHTRSLEIIIHKPWWQTGWAYAVYFLVAGGIGYLIYRAWLQRQQAKQQLILQKKEAAQLRVMDEMKSRFFSNITHEFRTPLSLVIAPLHSLLQKEIPGSLKRELAGIENNAQQLLHLVNQSLDMAKLEANAMKLTLYRGNLNDFTNSQVQAFASAALAKKQSLHFQPSTTTEDYLFDADKLHTILFNLLSNAVKFTPAGGHIQACLQEQPVSEENTQFVFSVKDSGIGIAEDKQPFIFNRFYQANGTADYGGTGIGLALAKELAALMQGTLAVSSQPGKGSQFTLTLLLQKAQDSTVPECMNHSLPPIGTAQCHTENEEATETENGEAAGKSLVLVVEDNVALNAFIAGSFRPHYRVLTAANGNEGLTIAVETLPDVIVSDWMMPGMDGIAFCREIKSNMTTSHIAFVQLTARGTPASRMEGLQSGADEYLTKPFIAEELLLRVANLLERQCLLRQKLQAELSQPMLQNGHLASTTVVSDPFLSKIYELVEEHLDDTAFGVAEIATGVGMSRANLHRKLKAVAGLTPGSIIRNYRLQQAAGYLTQGFNSSETAYKAGFETPAYFTKCFRDFFGVTPTEYQKKGSRGREVS